MSRNELHFLDLPLAFAEQYRGLRAQVRFEKGGRWLVFRFQREPPDELAGMLLPPALRFFAAVESGGPIRNDGSKGSIVVPFGKGKQGSTVLLPFQADYIVWSDLWQSGKGREGGEPHLVHQKWQGWYWEESEEFTWPHSISGPDAETGGVVGRLCVSASAKEGVRFVVYVKAMEENGGWGRLVATSSAELGQLLSRSGIEGDVVFPSAWVYTPSTGHIEERVGEPRRIYQLFPRLFNNSQYDVRLNGSLSENGAGKWNEITHAALNSIRGMGFTDVWLTGVLQHATATGYSSSGLPADPPDLLKGIAGSPYALKNPFDLSPDCASSPDVRFEEFRSLVKRVHEAGLRVLVDLVPNHISRGFRGQDIEAAVGEPLFSQEEKGRFFSLQNCFFYLPGQGPLHLPTLDAAGVPTTVTCRALGGCQGTFEAEASVARVTGNNAATTHPSLTDWYETVKLNYGLNFLSDEAHYPSALAAGEKVPPVWRMMDAAIEWWQKQGVDGFRCDMAHMIPPEFWMWAIRRAHERAAGGAAPEPFFLAEAYEDDPMRVASRSPLLAALNDGRGLVALNLADAGFDAIYDHTLYRKVKAIYDGVAWANDLTPLLSGAQPMLQRTLRYAENHDEVRLTAEGHWANVGMDVGRPVCALLFGLPHGGVLVYNGQEVGERATEAGYGGADGRTTLYDYWIMPELQKWVNGGAYDGGKLGCDQKALRACYGRLLALVGRPAFQHGIYVPLQEANLYSAHYGRLPGEAASGHWLFSFFRYDVRGGERFLVVINLHPSMAFRDVKILFPPEAIAAVGLVPGEVLRMEDCLSSKPPLVLTTPSDHVILPGVPPLTPYYFEVRRVSPAES